MGTIYLNTINPHNTVTNLVKSTPTLKIDTVTFRKSNKRQTDNNKVFIAPFIANPKKIMRPI